MEANKGSYGTSWEEQWDNGHDSLPRESNRKSGGGAGKGAKYKEKLGQGLERTKAMASVGFRKVKEGTSTGFHWIKDKYQKTTQKH